MLPYTAIARQPAETLSLIEITIEAKQNNGKDSLVYLSTVMHLCMFSRHLILSGYFYLFPFDFFHINKFQKQMSRSEKFG